MHSKSPNVLTTLATREALFVTKHALTHGGPGNEGWNQWMQLFYMGDDPGKMGYLEEVHYLRDNVKTKTDGIGIDAPVATTVFLPPTTNQ